LASPFAQVLFLQLSHAFFGKWEVDLLNNLQELAGITGINKPNVVEVEVQTVM